MKLGLLIFSLFFLSCLGNDWRCRFDFDGDIYDLTPGNSNPDSPNGFWQTSDNYGNYYYYFKLCEETTSYPGSLTNCTPGTQVCQKDFFSHSFSLGVDRYSYPYSSFGSQKGVVMHTWGGNSSGCSQDREGYLQVICPKGTSFTSGSFGPVIETEDCIFTIPFYHDAGCPRNPYPPNQANVLTTLYRSTDGRHWKNNNNWLSSSDPSGCNWYGVHCEDNVLTQVKLIDNGLVGTLPSELNYLIFAQSLYLQKNNLSGTIPDLSAIQTLKSLHLSSNILSGSFPNVKTAPLVELDLHSNQLTGQVPSTLCDIDYFSINENDWTCPFPSCCTAHQNWCGSCQ